MTLMTEPVIIGVDPHKKSWTAVAVDRSGHQLAAVRVPVSTSGYRRLRRFSDKYPNPAWALEGAYGLGAPLAALLNADGVQVLDVPAKLAARVRMLSHGHGRKSDEDDARSVAVAAVTSTTLRPVASDAAASELKLLTEYRDELVRSRTQAINRLHAVMTGLVLAGASRGLSADAAAKLLRRVQAGDDLTGARRMIAADLISEVRRLDKRITAMTDRISACVRATGTTLTGLTGVGPLTAAKILARTGMVERFASDSHFAAYAGVAPREVSSGDAVRHRLSRGGDRQLNYALHVVAITQAALPKGEGRRFYDRKRAEGKTRREALRALKRRLATVIYRQMKTDARAKTDPAGQSGTALVSSVAGSHPRTGSLEKSLTGPVYKQPNPATS